jgi:hypothetical protein
MPNVRFGTIRRPDDHLPIRVHYAPLASQLHQVDHVDAAKDRRLFPHEFGLRPGKDQRRAARVQHLEKARVLL